MALWAQNLIVLITVGGCLTFVFRQARHALAGRKSRLGSCCSKGCVPTTPQTGGKPNRIIFLPVEMLAKRRK